MSRNVEHVTYAEGHRVLRLDRKGGRRGTAPFAPPVQRALDTYLNGRASGPLFVTRTGGRFTRSAAYRLIQRLAQEAAIPAAGDIVPTAPATPSRPSPSTPA